MLVDCSASKCCLLYVRLFKAKKWRRLLQLIETRDSRMSEMLLPEIYILEFGKCTTQSSTMTVRVLQCSWTPRLPHGRECKYVDDSDVHLHFGTSPSECDCFRNRSSRIERFWVCMIYLRQELPELDKRVGILQVSGWCTSEATLLSESPKYSSSIKMMPNRQDAYKIVEHNNCAGSQGTNHKPRGRPSEMITDVWLCLAMPGPRGDPRSGSLILLEIMRCLIDIDM